MCGELGTVVTCRSRRSKDSTGRGRGIKIGARATLDFEDLVGAGVGPYSRAQTRAPNRAARRRRAINLMLEGQE